MSRRGRAWHGAWRPPGAPPPPVREAVAEEPAERPSWRRPRTPSLGQSAAVASRLGQGLPPAAVEGIPPAVEDDPTGPPLCPACHRRHETPGELRPPPMARTVLDRPGDSAALTRDAFGPPGWGRNRGRCS
jgi:hypothetical protein